MAPPKQFELVSKFQPAGDQPQAIEKILSGLQGGKPAQVLVGATGTGKSLAFDEPVLLRRRVGSSVRTSVEPIGALIDEQMQGETLTHGETQIAAPPDGLEAFAFDPHTCRGEWRPVTALTRHEVHGPLYRVRTTCGREVVVTGDHNFFSLNGGELGLRRTTDLGRDDYLPLPRAMAWNDADLPAIDLCEYVGEGLGLPHSLPVTRELLTLLGLMVASGVCSKDDACATFSCRSDGARDEFIRCAETLGVPHTRRFDGRMQLSSRAWVVLCRRLVGASSREKRLPPFWADLSRSQLGVLLRPCLESGEGATVSTATASRRLASELGYALAALDVRAYFRRRCKHASATDRAATHYHVVRVSGEDLRQLSEHVGLMADDAFPSRRLQPKEQPQFVAPDLDDRVHPLLHARWARVASVEAVTPAHPFVYDFTVEDHETFLAGHGGLFVHNTFTASNVIAQLNKPTLVLAHNKTLAAQLYKEFKAFFPKNAVQFFISYYDYYQPEAYIPSRDVYIEKDSMVNENIDRLRLAATSALVSRQDVLVVASVSCIYGLGSPSDYKRMMIRVVKNELVDRDNLLLRLVDIQYQRNDVSFERGHFRVRGDTVEVWPAYEEFALRIELFGDEVEKLSVINPLTGETLREEEDFYVYPAKHFVTPEERIKSAVEGIRAELDARRKELREQGKLLEEQRLAARTNFDVEMLLEVGHCPGIENYARFFSGRKPGEPPFTLIDFFPEDFLMIVDEAHATLPQLRGMFAGDHSRKLTLVEHGFRLPSAMDNRPYRFDEWEKRVTQVLFMSATPGPYELERTGGEVVEQIIRPTGLVDPILHVRPARGQVKDLENEIRIRTARKERTLVTALTKRLAEELSNYFREANLRCRWLHSELDAIERVQILRELREGAFDVLVGVNLLREGLDLPEVSLVAILDADKEGFLRSQTSLIQTIGRAARHVNAEVILYADKITDSMRRAMDETTRRRDIQLAYNAEHGITPTSVQTAISRGVEGEIEARKLTRTVAGQDAENVDVEEMVEELHAKMVEASNNQRYEEAIGYRDQIMKLRGEKVASPQPEPKKARPKRRR